MPAQKRAASYDDSSSGEEISVDEVVATKTELDKIRRERDKKRAQLQKDLDKKITDLRKRIKQTTDAHTKQLGAIGKQQVDRLVRAVEARDAIDRNIREKLAELQDEGANLAALLGRAYEHRAQKTRLVMKRDAEQLLLLPTEGEVDDARPAKKVKLDLRSTST